MTSNDRDDAVIYAFLESDLIVFSAPACTGDALRNFVVQKTCHLFILGTTATGTLGRLDCLLIALRSTVL